MSNLAALYPSGTPGVDYPHTKNDTWPSNWTPVPIHSVDFDSDHVRQFYCMNIFHLKKKKSKRFINISSPYYKFQILNAFAKCERADQIDETVKKSEEYQQTYRMNKV